MEESMIRLLSFGLICGAGGSLVGALVGFFSGDAKLRVSNSSGIGFLVGAAIGITIGVFRNLTGNL